MIPCIRRVSASRTVRRTTLSMLDYFPILSATEFQQVPERNHHPYVKQQGFDWIHEKEAVKKILDDIDQTQFNSGDKETFKTGDPKRTRFEFRECKELENADPRVQQLCSVEYGTKMDWKNSVKREYVSRVCRYESDSDSVEAAIASLTVSIRYMQNHIKTRTIGTHDGRATSVVIELVGRRNRYLERLRSWDYNKFCWILNELNLIYTPRPHRRIAKPEEIYRQITQNEALSVRRDKFVQFHNQLKAKQPEFLARKEKEFSEITEEENDILAQLEVLSQKEAAFKSGTRFEQLTSA